MPSSSLIPNIRYKSDYQGKLPHMSVKESAIWRIYALSKESQVYKGFDFDIKVGDHAIAALYDPSPSNMLKLGTLAKRIDAVGFLSDKIVDIFEVKPERLANGVGQLLLYRDLFESTYPNFSVNSLIAIVGEYDLELARFANSYNITVIVV